MRIVDIILAFPFLVLMLAIIAILGPGLTSFFIAMALVGWVSYARLIRAQILVLKTTDYAVAALSLGFSRPRIMFRHLLPNAIAGSLVFTMSDAVLVLLNGAAISYLGLGVQPPVAEWGVMVAEGQALHHHGLVDHPLPGPRHRRARLRLQPARRRPGRHPGPAEVTAAAPVLSVRGLTVELQSDAGPAAADRRGAQILELEQPKHRLNPLGDLLRPPTTDLEAVADVTPLVMARRRAEFEVPQGGPF